MTADSLSLLRLIQQPLVFVDFETTGLKPALGARIVEIGMVRYEQGEQVAGLKHLVNPERPIGDEASAVNGIFDDDVRGAPRFVDLIDQVLPLVQDAVLVAHHASFDAAFLGTEMMIARTVYGRQIAPERYERTWLDTLLLSRAVLNRRYNGLDDLCLDFSIKRERAHRAYDDALATVQVLEQIMIQMLQEAIERGQFVQLSLETLFARQGGPVQVQVPDPPPPPSVIASAFASREDVLLLYGGDDAYRMVRPLYVTTMNGSSYLVAYCHRVAEHRTFRLDRLRDVQSWDFVPPPVIDRGDWG